MVLINRTPTPEVACRKVNDLSKLADFLRQAKFGAVGGCFLKIVLEIENKKRFLFF